MRYFLDISYEGTAYHGWQIQPTGNTVQEEIEKALSTILKEKISIMGSGRTDTRVHATQQIAHFDTLAELTPADLVYKLNSFLPKDIAIRSIKAVGNDAHARFDAVKRTYHYHLHQGKNPFKQDVSYHFKQDIDRDAILEGCEIIRNWENFECFSKVHTEVNNFNCQIFAIDWLQNEDSDLFVVTANRFLRGMVRAMVGTLLDLGTHKTNIEDLKGVLESNDRSRAGRAVPPQGLFLERIEYPTNVYN
ncbi:MAG: tRNA pseudouridine(38-40) synthase TruA [Cyclobacteriaceae bacterium]